MKAVDQEICEIERMFIASGTHGLALDIDDTLSATTELWMEAALERFGNPEQLDSREMTERYLSLGDVPYWDMKEMRPWMDELCVSHQMQLDYQCIPLAKERVPHLTEHFSVYVTMRPRCVLTATRTWLNTHGFPEMPIIARPDNLTNAERHGWKAQTLERLYPHITGIVDDDPDVVHALSPNYKGTIYLFGKRRHDSDHVRVVRCETWDHVHDSIKAKQ